MRKSSPVSPEIGQLVTLLSKLPGFGPRSARRAVLHLLKKPEQLLIPLVDALSIAAQKVTICDVCGNLDTIQPCRICTGVRSDSASLCIVADVSDLWALERSGTFKGYYHVLGGTLSALDGVGPDDLRIAQLLQRVNTMAISEIILALNATVDGQTTAHYIADLLENYDVKITRLAHGVPVGGELSHLDDGTLAAALASRNVL